MYLVESSNERRISICHRLIMRALDEDETVKVSDSSGPITTANHVKDLAIKTISELWFGNEGTSDTVGGGSTSINSLNAKVTVIMSVCIKFPSTWHSPLEFILTQVLPSIVVPVENPTEHLSAH